MSIWETAIKRQKELPDCTHDARDLRTGLIEFGWTEIPISAEHAITAAQLPPIHGDPFDRMLVAQATIEDALLLTGDRVVARYPGPVRQV